MTKNVYWFSCNVHFIFLILMKLQSARQLVEKKYSNVKFNENRSSGTELFHVDRRTDGQT